MLPRAFIFNYRHQVITGFIQNIGYGGKLVTMAFKIMDNAGSAFTVSSRVSPPASCSNITDPFYGSEWYGQQCYRRLRPVASPRGQ
jgi:hypothetical protein